MNDNAAGLHRTARTIIAEVERAQPAWFSEWSDFLLKLLGPRPDEQLGSRAHENWNLVAMGAAMVFDFLVDPVNVDDTQPQEEPVEGASDDGSTPEATLTPSEITAGLPSVKPPTFAILGPDGQPVVEGYRGD